MQLAPPIPGLPIFIMLKAKITLYSTLSYNRNVSDNQCQHESREKTAHILSLCVDQSLENISFLYAFKPFNIQAFAVKVKSGLRARLQPSGTKTWRHDKCRKASILTYKNFSPEKYFISTITSCELPVLKKMTNDRSTFHWQLHYRHY